MCCAETEMFWTSERERERRACAVPLSVWSQLPAFQPVPGNVEVRMPRGAARRGRAAEDQVEELR